METWRHGDMETWRNGEVEHGHTETWTWRHEIKIMGKSEVLRKN